MFIILTVFSGILFFMWFTTTVTLLFPFRYTAWEPVRLSLTKPADSSFLTAVL